MDNKNAAPERIEPVTNKPVEHDAYEMHKRFVLNQVPQEIRAYLAPIYNEYPSTVATICSYIAAMQPTPSESDEAVAREIADLISDADNAGMDRPLGQVADIIARHRTPVARMALSEKLDAINNQTVPAPEVAAPYGAEGLRALIDSVPDYTWGASASAVIHAANDGLVGHNITKAGEKLKEMVIDDLTKALAQSPLPADGWRTIDSAPKDGTAILIAWRNQVYRVSWRKGIDASNHDWNEREGWFITEAEDPMCSVSFLDDEEQPTHWQPLPTPPAPIAAQGEV